MTTSTTVRLTQRELTQRHKDRLALPPPSERKAARERAGWSLDDMARLVPCTRQAVYLWENGKREPSDELLGAYVKALDLAKRLERASA